MSLDSDGMDALLATHCLDPAFLRADDYEGFIESRRRILLGQVSKAMGKSLVASDEAVAEDDEADED